MFRDDERVICVKAEPPLVKGQVYTVAGDFDGEVLLWEVPKALYRREIFEAEWQPKYDIVYADPPWPMWGCTKKNAAAGKHYDLMSQEEIEALRVRNLFRDPKHGVAFVWATCPRLNLAIDAIRAWGLHFRGVAFNWVKTRNDGAIIHGQGVRPTVTKPTSELCLVATTCKRGRPLPLLSEKTPQVVLHQRGRHSEKPQAIRDHIVELYGDRPRIELFARTKTPGWDVWGNEAP